MKRVIIYGFILIAGSLSSCSDFEGLNTNPLGVSDLELSQDNSFIGSHFPAIQQSIYFNFNTGNGADYMYQTFQNLNADIWSGYMASPSNFRGGVNNQTYALVPGWDDSCWSETYTHLMPNSLKIKEKVDDTGRDTYFHFDAINTILRVLGMSRMCDQYGPIIYSRYGESLLGGVYDSGPDVYKKFFEELDTAVKELEKALNGNVADFSKFDMAYGGDYTRWMKLANSLRLRLALRIVKYDPALARQQAEAAVKAPQGVMKANSDNFTISGFGYRNPIATISGRSEWNDIHISANIVSILGGYKDNRLPKYALASPQADGVIIGVRTGIPDLDQLETQYKAILANINIVSPDEPVILFTAAETCFLQAEAALRGWDAGGGTARSFYETGIKTSFEQWGASLGDYLESNNKPAPFIDALKEDFNSPPASEVTPCWDDAGTDEERLEKICTQRWIAVFPEGMNAWAIVRRTGYPRLFPILKNDSQGIIPTGLGVRRLPYTESEKRNNPEGYAQAVQLLGGPDNGATRIFWDIDRPNF
jgi:hypothetical protein